MGADRTTWPGLHQHMEASHLQEPERKIPPPSEIHPDPLCHLKERNKLVSSTLTCTAPRETSPPIQNLFSLQIIKLHEAKS